jgi:hypothetical protein
MSLAKREKQGWKTAVVPDGEESEAAATLRAVEQVPGVVLRAGSRVLVHPLFADVVTRYGWPRLSERAPEYAEHFRKHGFIEGAKQLIGYARFVAGEVSLTLTAGGPPS